MSIGDPYISSDDLGEYLGVTGANEDEALTAACVSATGWVNRHCARDFNQETAATARVYVAEHPTRLHVDDFHTITDLVVETDDASSGSYGTTWSASDYVLEPFNGIENGRTGHPFRTIVAVESRLWPCSTGRPRVQITAQWGWAAVPVEVRQATKILAAEIFRLKDAPLGIAGFNDFGPLRVREVPQVAMLLEQFLHPSRTGPFVA